MRLFLFIVAQCIMVAATGQEKITIYLLPGEGSDERIFSKIQFDTNYRAVHVVLPTPAKNCTMKEYAQVVGQQIDTSGRYIFIGVSFGGMICSELAEYMQPEKIIVISSAKCSRELPMRYTF